MVTPEVQEGRVCIIVVGPHQAAVRTTGLLCRAVSWYNLKFLAFHQQQGILYRPKFMQGTDIFQ